MCSAINVRVSLRGNLPENAGSLVVINHLGVLDPWVLASCFPVALAAKVEMDAWPVFGWVGQSVGLIYVDRERRMNTTGFVEKVQRRMRDGVDVLVFPEGTTSDGVTLRPFKTGGFAAVANMEDGFVLPLYMWARRVNDVNTNPQTRKLVTWPEGTSMISNAWQVLGLKSVDMEILVGDLIPTAGMDRKELAMASQDQVESLMRSTLQDQVETLMRSTL